ncbi:MAG: hypothetical protein AB7O04_16815 [Hyphomonadaceae bacterium]
MSDAAKIIATAILERWMQKIDNEMVLVGPPVLAKSIISALSSAGFAIVPREATESMVERGAKRICVSRHAGYDGVAAFAYLGDREKFRAEAQAAWTAMIAAAEAEARRPMQAEVKE